MIRLSARNQFSGTITKITRGAVNGIVTIDIGDNVLSSNISLNAIQELRLEEGKKVMTFIKATDVMMADDLEHISARNKFRGTVVSLETGPINAFVRIKSGKHIVTSVTSVGVVNQLSLKEGAEAVAIIRSANVLIGVEIPDDELCESM